MSSEGDSKLSEIADQLDEIVQEAEPPAKPTLDDIAKKLTIVAESLGLLILAIGGTPIPRNMLIQHVLALGVGGDVNSWLPDQSRLKVVGPGGVPFPDPFRSH